MTGSRWIRALAAAALLALAWPATPASAVEQTVPGWRLRVAIAGIDFHSNLNSHTGYGIDVGAALAVNGEYRFNRRLGLDIGAFGGGGVDVAGHRSRIGWHEYDVYDTMSLSGLSAGVDVHLTPDSRIDLYFCPMLAVVQFGSIVVAAGPGGLVTGVDFDEDLAVGAGLGLGVPIGGRQKWSFNASVTHFESTLDGRDRGDLRVEEDYDATMVGLGFGYRF